MSDTPNQLAISVPSDTRFLHSLTNLARNAAEVAGFDAPTAQQISIAVAEAVTNVMEHAYAGEGGHTLDVEFRILPEGIEIHVIHAGKPMDPRAAEAAARGAGRKKGGFGVIIMRRVMDQVDYSFTADHRNDCCMVKRRPAGHAPVASPSER